MRAEIIDKWREYVAKLAAAVKDVLPDSRVYVFGSVVKGEATAASDIDVLIVSNAVPKSGPERAALKVRIEGSAAPHLITPSSFILLMKKKLSSTLGG